MSIISVTTLLALASPAFAGDSLESRLSRLENTIKLQELEARVQSLAVRKQDACDALNKVYVAAKAEYDKLNCPGLLAGGMETFDEYNENGCSGLSDKKGKAWDAFNKCYESQSAPAAPAGPSTDCSTPPDGKTVDEAMEVCGSECSYKICGAVVSAVGSFLYSCPHNKLGFNADVNKKLTAASVRCPYP